MRMRISVAILCLLCSPGPVAAEPLRPDVLIYHGMYTETDFLPIVFRQRTDYRNSWITVVGLNQPLGTNIRWITFEAEGQLGIHTGIMKHGELNGLLLARLPRLFGLPFSLAMGDGLSMASQNPSLENKEKGIRIGDMAFNMNETVALMQNPNFPFLIAAYQLNPQESRHLLNFLVAEAEFRREDEAWSPGIFMRIHHRSGVFGLYCPPDPACGSNFVSYGVKWRLP